MRNFLFILSVLALIIACEKEPVLNIREGMDFKPDTIAIESSVKGWELYSWQSNTSWRYSLIVGTNRIKTSADILSNPYNVNGKEQLKILLRKLPIGEQIIWIGPEWIGQNISGVTDDVYEMPSLLTQYDIHSFCEKRTILLSFVP